MTRISAYICKQLFWSTILVLLVVLSLDSLSRVVEQTGEIRENYNFLQLLYYILLTLPSQLVEYMPYAALIGCLTGMGLLANNSEIIVMRAAGLSMWRLITYALIPVIFVMVGAMLVSELAVPKLNQFAEQQRVQQRYASLMPSAKNQFWNRENNEFMRIDSLSFDGNIRGLSRYRFDENLHLLNAQYAESASYVDGKWLMRGVKETQFDTQQIQLQRKDYAVLDWYTKTEPNLLKYLIIDPEDLNILHISHFITYLNKQGLNTESYRLAFWKKIFYPLTAISLILIAISGIFGSLRQRSIGYRIFIGIVIGVGFRMIQNLITPAALVYDWSPFLASLLPIALCFAVGLYSLRRVY